jgi:sugar/nucleoside kinase (ribokinase family)
VGTTREQTCETTARKLLEASAGLSERRAVIGLDGFVDSIVSVVDKRYSPEHYDPVRTIGLFAEKIRSAAGESSNYELVVKRQKLGGNGPIMANALASLGLGVTYVGALGYPQRHSVFDDLAHRATVYSVAEPGFTDALEFDDGKLMLGKYETLAELGWDELIARVGTDRLLALFKSAQLVGLVNWTMIPQMGLIWSELLDRVFVAGERREGTMFIDLADPEKRTPDDILEALRLLTRFQERVDVTFGMNLKEATEVAQVLGFPPRRDPEADIAEEAEDIREALSLSCVVIHPRRAAAAATADDTAWFPGPFVEYPLISTGAGDHFNAGFCLGRVLGLDLVECLCTGAATSGYYVRTAQSPTVAQLAEFVAQLPPPQLG